VFRPLSRARRMGCGDQVVRVSGARRQSLHTVGHCAVIRAGGACGRSPQLDRQARRPRGGDRRAGDARRQAPIVSRTRAAQRFLRARPPCGDVDISRKVSVMGGLFSQLVMLGGSGMLLTALMVLWRKGVPAYISAYRWQAWILAALSSVVGYFSGDWRLYWVAAVLVALKGVAIPALLRAMHRRFATQTQIKPYINTETSLLLAAALALFAYVLARPLMAVTAF